MSDASDRREARETRRRWATLAELVAVAGVIIAALTLWNSWADRRAAEADKIAARAATAQAEARVDLSASVRDGGQALLLRDARHQIQDITIAFPAALGVDPQQPPGDPLIEADGFSAPLLKLTDGGGDDRSGRLPVMITVSYVDGDTIGRSTGLYDIVWRTEGRLLRGRALKLEGLRLRSRHGTQATLDDAWAHEAPKR